MKSPKEQRRATKSNEKQQKATKSDKKQQRTSEMEKPKRARKRQDEQGKAQKVQMETRLNANQHFYEVRQCQKNNWILKMDWGGFLPPPPVFRLLLLEYLAEAAETW